MNCPTHATTDPAGRPRTRGARVRRAVMTSAAALFVAVAPTACGIAAASDSLDRGDVSRSADAARRAGQQDAGGNGAAHAGHAGSGQTDTAAAATSTTTAPDQARNGQGRAQAQDSQGQGRNGQGQNGQGQGQGNAGAADQTNGLDVLARDCENSKLQPHTGFQDGNRCVETAFGEVGTADKNPTLLITGAPAQVPAGQSFELKVSTRNLVRDRFLGAAAGGYYLESSLLNAQGIQRGHFHTACRTLPSTDVAPDGAPDPEFFLATQDNKGGAGADTVTITVPGLKTKGTAQCSSWAGDGSHRIPMMQRANQTPAFDSVRIEIT